MPMYKNPSSAQWYPHGDHKQSLWITIEGMILSGQSAYGRGEVEAKPNGFAWQFLAPREFIESTVHEWSDYESLVGRAVQKRAELGKMGTEVYGALSAAIEGAKEANLNAALNKAGTIKVVNYRVDAPLYYKGSERRKIDLIFHIIEEGNPYNDVVEPVRTLQKASSAEKTNAWYSINPPNVFTVASWPNKAFLYIKYAALRSVQPTWRGPYISGIPTSCELTLSFEDITPLFDTSFRQDLINVSETKGETSTTGPTVPLLSPTGVVEQQMQNYYDETPAQKGTGPLRDYNNFGVV